MATSTYPAMGGAVDNTSAATFIPEIWSDEVIAAYQKNLVLANLVKKLSMTGKKGDTLHIPKPTRGSANEKAAGTAVTIQADTETEVRVTIDKHFEYSRLIEDITEAQALASLRQFYTGDAGYALANQVDSDLFALGKNFGTEVDVNASTTDWVNSNSYFVGASSALTALATDTASSALNEFDDDAFRALIQKMDEADVPMDGRCLVVPPSVRNQIMGITRYTSSDFVNGQTVVNGQIGNLYGVDVYVSNNCPTTEATAAGKGAMFFHKDAMVLAEQQGVRSQTQYKQDFLATLYTADTLYGTQVVRPEAGFVLTV
jgi:N4-gp56 family major capsid protein